MPRFRRTWRGASRCSLLTLVLVPSLCFLIFAWIQGDATSLGDLLSDLLEYMNATFLQGGLDTGTVHGSGFLGEVYNRTRTALDTVRQGFLIDVYLLVGALTSALVIGVLAGAVQATYPRSFVSRVITVATALVLSSPLLARADGAAAVRAQHRLGRPPPVPVHR